MMKYLLVLTLSFSLFANPLSESKKAIMIQSGVYHDGCPVPLSDLRSIIVSYHDSQHKVKRGELIVHKEVEEEVKKIFDALFKRGFVIAQIRPMRDFNASDEASMRANNTSAFNCRTIKGTDKFSKHSYGKAIDINPLWNPCIVKGEVSPKTGVRFVDREVYHDGKICQGDFVVKCFKKHGWKWGGAWHSLKDYQHFEK